MFKIWGAFVISSCDKTNKEARRTAIICYQILLGSDNFQEFKLEIFTEYVSYCCPQISIADVMDINLNTLLGLLGSITTYVVVLVTFNTIK